MKKKLSNNVVIVILIAFSLVSILLTLCMGAVEIPVDETFSILKNHLIGGLIGEESVNKSFNQIVWGLRMPRVILGFVVGSGLALCGAVMQAVVQNPMAEPYILGVSSGATLGATFSIMVGLSSIIGFNSFLGAAIACFLVLALATKGGGATSSKLILSGMVVNALFTAFSNFIISIAGDSNGIMTIKFWTMGSLTRASWSNILPVVICICVGSVFFITQHRILNTMLLGDEAAITLGIDMTKYRIIYLFVISILTGIIVASCGTIGFLGLIVPHVSRAVVGNDHRRLLPITTIVGGIFMVWMDALARTLVENTELPVGIFTALVGAPFFIYILIKKNYDFGK